MNIEGRTACVTGASSGMGAAIAASLARAGAKVLLLARGEEALQRIASEIRREGRQSAVYPVDLTDSAAVAETAALIAKDHGTPDILVNNAGGGRWLFLEETEPESIV